MKLALTTRTISLRYTVIAAACLTLALWTWWWVGSLIDQTLRYPQWTWLPVWQFLGLDLLHNYLGARAWLDGVNPYLQPFGDHRGLYAYPPVVLPLFAWARLVNDPVWVVGLWALTIAVGCATCVWQIKRFRRAEGLVDLPFLAMLALILWSSPVVFAMERGNCDVLVLFCIVFAAMALGKSRNWHWEALAGGLLALAVMIKIYPLMAVAVLVALRRWRVLAITVSGIALLLLLPGDTTHQWLSVMKETQSARVNPIAELLTWLQGGSGPASAAQLKQMFSRTIGLWGSVHSPGNWWPAFWARLGVGSIAYWPLLVVHILMLAPATLWGCWRIFRTPDPSRLILPLLLWVMTTATFWMPVSYDYNLIYMPLLIVALWDKSNARWIQVVLVLSLLWWLPFGPIGYDWSLARVLLKLLAFYTITLVLIRRLNLPTVLACGKAKQNHKQVHQQIVQ